MALPILDGNQSATTLSTIVTGGQHIPAHTVVSLGSQAITDMRSAVSGSVVSISNFPASQTVAGTVTANVAGQYFDFTSGDTAQLVNPVYYDGEIYRVTPSFPLPVTIRPAPYGQTVVTISGTVTANVFGARQNGAGTIIPVSIAGDDQSENGIPIAININGETQILGDVNPLPISGTVTANLPALNYNTVKISFAEKSFYNGIYKKGTSGYVNTDGGGIPVYAPIDEKFSGGVDPVLTRSIQTGSGATFSGIRWNFQEVYNGEVQFYAATTATDLRLVTEWYDSSGEVSVSITPYSVEPVAITNSVTVGSLPAISGTVTANNPSGALTTRFGSVTTANTAQLTSAVTNTSRKYLLVQNIATSTVTIGIGFAPTTTQGIQLTAGAGLTFDAFCPTGGVWWLSSTTGSNFSILEG
jgi:hypothetical protein